MMIMETPPPGAIGHEDTRAVLAVLAARRPTVRTVAAATGKSLSVTHDRLHRLRRLGLVRFEPGRAGTMRPAVHAVPHRAAPTEQEGP